MERFTRWLIEAPWSHMAVFAGGTLGTVAGGGLYARQLLLTDHQVCRAATEQLKGAEVVHRILGGSDVSRVGPVGGYVDQTAGTAVLTMTLATSSGGRAAASDRRGARRRDDAVRLADRPGGALRDRGPDPHGVRAPRGV